MDCTQNTGVHSGFHCVLKDAQDIKMRDNGLPNPPFPVSVFAPTPPLRYLFYLRTRKRNFLSAALHSIYAKLESHVCCRIAFDRLPPTLDGGTRLRVIIIARSRRLASLRRSWVRVVRASPASSAQAVVQTPSAGSKRAGQSARLRVCVLVAPTAALLVPSRL